MLLFVYSNINSVSAQNNTQFLENITLSRCQNLSITIDEIELDVNVTENGTVIINSEFQFPQDNQSGISISDNNTVIVQPPLPPPSPPPMPIQVESDNQTQRGWQDNLNQSGDIFGEISKAFSNLFGG